MEEKRKMNDDQVRKFEVKDSIWYMSPTGGNVFVLFGFIFLCSITYLISNVITRLQVGEYGILYNGLEKEGNSIHFNGYSSYSLYDYYRLEDALDDYSGERIKVIYCLSSSRVKNKGKVVIRIEDLNGHRLPLNRPYDNTPYYLTTTHLVLTIGGIITLFSILLCIYIKQNKVQRNVFHIRQEFFKRMNQRFMGDIQLNAWYFGSKERWHTCLYSKKYNNLRVKVEYEFRDIYKYDWKSTFRVTHVIVENNGQEESIFDKLKDEERFRKGVSCSIESNGDAQILVDSFFDLVEGYIITVTNKA